MSDPDFTPIIPPAVAQYYLSKNGLNLQHSKNGDKIVKLLSLATQKFVSDIANNAFEFNRIRSSSAVYNASNPTARSKALMMATASQALGKTNDGEDTGAAGGNVDANGASSGADAGSGSAVAGSGANEAASGTNTNANLGTGGGSQGQQKVVLTMEDLSSALNEYGLNVNRPQFYR
ncbi:unnamed protein product [Ambrosiozyma monospora]|uniref:Unnamed protein product n=1 Tax=Ambrosiozyma monospora TaxID=43982 RepID=A0ACB5SWR6_AMBMO|nr:unnamed protein product [Ambrosiozyma monospora]